MKTALMICAIMLLQLQAFSQRSHLREEEEEGERTEGITAQQYWEQLEASINRSNKIKVKNKNFFLYQQWKKEQQKRQQERGTTAFSPTLNGGWLQLSQVQSNVGMGRIESVAFDPNNSSTFYVATSGGGLWKTTNDGTSYSPLTDGIPTGGVEQVVVDANNSNTIYIACGGGAGANNPSIGILKSTDGGSTWHETGFMQDLFPSTPLYIYDLVQQPGNSSVLFAAVTDGVYKTSNGGSTWQHVYTSSYPIFDLEFKPNDPTVIYASMYFNIAFSNSNGNAATWNVSSSYPAFPVSGCCSYKSTRIAVTAAAPDSLYLSVTLGQKYENSGDVCLLKGKINAAHTAITYGTPSKIKVGSSVSMVESGSGRGYAEIFVSASNNKNMIVGGVDDFASSDYGKTWIVKNKDNNGSRIVHADAATIVQNGSYIYITCDGGIYRQTANFTSNTAWTDLSAGMEITQSYNIAGTPQDTHFYIYSNQDNGTQTRTASTYTNFVGGDGTNCGIDYNDENIYYGCIQAGEFLTRYDNGNYTDITVGGNCNCPDSAKYSGAFVFPFALDENTSTTLYGAKRKFYKSINKGSNWSYYTIGTSTANQTAFAVAKSNTNVIYSVEGTGNGVLRRTTTGPGGTWSVVTTPANCNISSVTTSPTNSARVYLTSYGNNAGEKVWVSTNSGGNWTNISGDLPNVNVRCLAYQPGSANGIYAGTDIGVYYRDDNLGHWIPYNNGLPITYCMDFYINTGESSISVGTYGRGIWYSGLYDASACPSTLSVNAASVSGRNTYSSSGLLTSTTTVTGSVESKIQFTSASDIQLKPGFQAQRESNFVAEIAPCGGQIDSYKMSQGKTKKALPGGSKKPKRIKAVNKSRR